MAKGFFFFENYATTGRRRFQLHKLESHVLQHPRPTAVHPGHVLLVIGALQSAKGGCSLVRVRPFLVFPKVVGISSRKGPEELLPLRVRPVLECQRHQVGSSGCEKAL